MLSFRSSLRRPRSGCQPAPLHSFARPRPRLAKALGPCLHALHDRDLALMPPSIAPHPRVEFVQATAVSAVWSRVRGPTTEHIPSVAGKSMRDRMMRVAFHKARHHGNAAQNILDGADVEAGEGGGAGRIVEHRHPFPLHDAAGRKSDRLECAEEGQGHLGMAPCVIKGACGAQGAPEK